jgi:predicted NBD/HSP70 family sugar kinase
MNKKVGVDVGGTWLRAGIVESEADGGGISGFVKRPTPTNLDQLVDLLSPFCGENIEGFGVAVSGPIADHAQVIQAPNIPWLEGRNLQQDLEVALGNRVIVSNDMEASTEGEFARGVLRRFRWAVFDTISTGWGGNLILNGLRVDSEPGHANVTFDTPYRCGSGHVGCREALYSGSALERQIGEHLRARKVMHSRSSAELWDAFHLAVSQGSDWALVLLDVWAEGVGRAWANMLNLIRPLQAIVYMGTTAESLLPIPRVQDRLRETMYRICIYPEHRRPDFPILPAEVEHRAIYGAVIVFDKVSL